MDVELSEERRGRGGERERGRRVCTLGQFRDFADAMLDPRERKCPFKTSTVSFLQCFGLNFLNFCYLLTVLWTVYTPETW